MEFNAVDGLTLITLRIAGAIFALAGLWLVLKPQREPVKGDGDEDTPLRGTKIKAFGLEFEASSAGLLIVLIGVALLVSPLFVSEKVTWNPPGDREGLEQGDFKPASPVNIEGGEQEPNNSLASANIVPIGAVITGDVAHDNEDFFKVETPGDTRGELVVTALAEYIGLTILKDDGSVVYSRKNQTTVSWRGPFEGTKYYAIRIQQWTGRNPMPYQVMVVARPE